MAAGLKKCADELAALCPPERFVVVGVGGSPSPIIAHLQTRATEFAVTCPLSTAEFRAKARLDLSVDRQRALDDHFEKFIPGKDPVAGRSIALVDFACSGQSLKLAARLIDAYLVSRGRAPTAHAVFLLAPPRFFSLGAKDVYLPVSARLDELFWSHRLKPMAEYPSFVPGATDPADLVPNPEYARYRDSLKNPARVSEK